jgi:hypothetical protein
MRGSNAMHGPAGFTLGEDMEEATNNRLADENENENETSTR